MRMFESGKKGNAAKKAYEIAYALFRISAKIAESSIKEMVESKAIDLLVFVNAEEYDSAAKAVAAIDALVKFAVDLNLINIANGDILLREISIMHEVVIECLDKSDEVDASKFFSKQKESVVKDVDRARPSVVMPRLAVIPAEAGTQERKSLDPVFQRGDNVVQSGNPANVIKSGNRQIAILDKIRQSGNCKLREIQDILPDCSERTIRYDLEDLIERNLVERVGAGGPAVAYRIRQMGSDPAIL
jgi:DeoR-like protein with HTH domain